jgi:hypothetical protein
VRRALGVAPGNYYFASGVLATYTAYCRSRVLLRGSCYSTSIKHYKSRTSGVFCPPQTLFPELLFNSGSVRLGGAATEIFYVKAGHGTILAYVHLRFSDVPETLEFRT